MSISPSGRLLKAVRLELKGSERNELATMRKAEQWIEKTRLQELQDTGELIPLRNALDSIWIAEIGGGVIRLIDGEAKGWSHWRRGVMFGFRTPWATAMDRLFGPEIRNEAAHTIEGLLLCGQAHEANRLAVQLFDSDTCRLYRRRGPLTPHQAYACALADLEVHGDPLRAEAISRVGDEGPYTAIFRTWTSPGSLAESIASICDYHLKHIKYSLRDGGEFFTVSSRAFPLEVLCLRRIRRKMGLDTPSISHPLLDSNPLFVDPPPFGPFKDPIWEKVEKFIVGSGFPDAEDAKFRPLYEERIAKLMKRPSSKAVVAKSAPSSKLDEALLSEAIRSSSKFYLKPPCITIDWKDMPGDVLDQAAACLPKKSFSWDFTDAAETKLEFRFGERTTKAKLPKWDGESDAPRIHKLLKLVRDFLKPDWDIKILAETSGDDTQTFLIMPSAWFADFAKRHPKESKKLFCELEKAAMRI